ncbi:hypothetical protein OIU91_28275 [Streptomyces sp. NBC_01456]|uniref:hypothetical protein n=1 Tax=unclassified Streptomyces TaxID=2593676 RepID=UPI002E362762|nr:MULTISPECIES: hypothetical protein [unclassified Streptomyces]
MTLSAPTPPPSTEVVAAAPPIPTAGLIASLNVRTWLDHTADDTVFSALLITHPVPQFEAVDPSEVERRMRGVALAIGAVPLGTPPPEIAARVTCQGETALVHFEGCPYSIKVPAYRHWAKTVTGFGQVLLAVGLDALPAVASRAHVDEYLQLAGEYGRMHFALATLGGSPGDIRAAVAAITGGTE